MRLLTICLLFVAATGAAQTPSTITREQYREDFASFWNTAREEFAYWHLKHTNWDSVKPRYDRELDTVRTRWQFTLFMERVLRELYDHHAGLNTNTSASYRLVPTGADIWARFENGKARIVEIRRGTGAAAAGIKPGMEVVAINGQPVVSAVDSLLPRCGGTDAAARDYCLQVLLAGTHATPRVLTLRGVELRDYRPDEHLNMDRYRLEELLGSRVLPGNIGYIRIHNSLGDNELIAAFDSVLNTLRNTRGLILDMRETPSGGNTTVARAMMGRFITQAAPYQKHELAADETVWGVKRSWVELVSPRGVAYKAPLIVLAGPWTGSMGEGIVIGLQGMKRARVLGNRMAGLCGAIYSYRMPNSGIGYNLPAERLYHVDGTPREDFRNIRIVVTQPVGADNVIEAARRLLTGSR